MDERIPLLDLLLRRERAVTAAGLAVITGLSWLWLVGMADPMAPPGMAMPGMGMGAMLAAGPASWTALDFGLTAIMWAVMMIAMMLPSAAPMILIYGLARRRQRAKGRGGEYASNGAFAAGYLFAWAGFSIAATALQWGLEQAALLSPMAASASPWAGRRVAHRGRALPSSPPSSRPAWSVAARPSSSSRATGGPGQAGRSPWACTTAPTAWAAAGS